MPSDAKQLFVEHLAATHPQGWCLVSDVNAAVAGGARRLRLVSRCEIIDDPDDDRLPAVRLQQLARADDHEENRFLLDQTIELGVDDSPSGVEPTRVRFAVWDPLHGRVHEFPLHEFFAFPGSALRLADYLLPFPEVTTWQILPGSTAPRSTAPPDRRCKVLAIDIAPPPAGAGPVTRLLWPVLRSVRTWIDEADLRLHLVEMGLADGRVRTTQVDGWTTLGGATVASDLTVTDVTGASNRLTRVKNALKGFGPGYFTRLRLEHAAF